MAGALGAVGHHVPRAVGPDGCGHEFLHFVVAADQRQGGVVPQALHVLLGFQADALLKGRGQVVEGAGIHEILPDHQSQLVANIIEEIIRVIAAAPYADDVEMGQGGVLQQAAGALGGDAAEDIVLGNVIRAHGEHLHPVDLVAEGFAPFVPFPANGQRPQANATLPGAAGHLRPNGIQRLPAIAVGPPQAGMVNHDVPAVAAPGLPIGRGHGDGHRRVPFQLRAEAQGNPARLVLLLHQNAEDAGRIHQLQFDVPPDARVGQAGPPVPAKHAVGLAQVGIAGNRVGGAPAGALLIGSQGSLHGGVEADEQAVAPGVQKRLHIPLPGDMHVVGIAGVLSVDGYMGQGVQPVAM